MAKTRTEIQFKVLAILTNGNVGVNPADEDTDNIDGYIDAVVDELAADTIYIADADALEEKLFLSFCELVANAAAHEYGGKHNPEAGQYWRNRLRVLTRPTPGYGPQETTDY